MSAFCTVFLIRHIYCRFGATEPMTKDHIGSGRTFPVYAEQRENNFLSIPSRGKDGRNGNDRRHCDLVATYPMSAAVELR